MIFDLHTHTRSSYDGFTSADELLAACLLRGINAVAVTEHDVPCLVDKAHFSRHGIELIPGCEYTDNNNAHIIGLFVHKELPKNLPAVAILDHIHSEGGLAVMPHPWKPGSGFMSMNSDRSLVNRFNFIELINGGWSSTRHHDDIVRLALEFGLRMISSSDSHKASHVGLCGSRIAPCTSCGDARSILEAARQSDIELLIDRRLLQKNGRYATDFQKSTLYQSVLPLFHPRFRRIAKLALYISGNERQAFQPDYQVLPVLASK